jgi:hypothetical protein
MCPRFVTIIIDELGCAYPNVLRGSVLRGSEKLYAFRSCSNPPVSLHICQESRTEALTVYQPCFETKMSFGPRWHFSNQAEIYFSYEMDTAYFKWPRPCHLGIPVGSLAEKDKRNLRSIGTDSWRNVIKTAKLIVRDIFYFKKLEEMVLPMRLYTKRERPDEVREDGSDEDREDEFDEEGASEPDAYEEIDPDNDQEMQPDYYEETQPDDFQEFQTDFHQVIQPEYNQEMQPGYHQELQPDFYQEIQPDFNQEIQSDYNQEIQPGYHKEIEVCPAPEDSFDYTKETCELMQRMYDEYRSLCRVLFSTLPKNPDDDTFCMYAILLLRMNITLRYTDEHAEERMHAHYLWDNAGYPEPDALLPKLLFLDDNVLEKMLG